MVDLVANLKTENISFLLHHNMHYVKQFNCSVVIIRESYVFEYLYDVERNK